ncbi:SPOR domain-containing protein [Cupriavidus sp. CV2]|uniref:SPOR domain-containing protein n=1 Tax=Cupriavidus ulmosensis TaxID=3065913 RepID=UPI00296AA5D5|nr:SPOR domain-containing protein [Cupriavidus sp. CV2]MDW3688166.1 SPOR domain-containing protein [Cupriavidus sp. CV2]
MLQRSLFILLVPVNALLLAAVLGAFGPQPLAGWMESAREPERAAQQTRAERFRQMPQASGKRPASTPAAAAATTTDATPAATPAAAPAMACVEIGGFNGELVRKVADELAGAPPGAWRVEQFERQEQARWWVHLPPQASRENLQRKLGELRRRNITDVSVVSAGSPETYTVSLGLFQEREHAEHFLDNLREHGVRTAVLTDTPHPLTRQWLRVRNADAALRTRLDEMRQRYGAQDLLTCT